MADLRNVTVRPIVEDHKGVLMLKKTLVALLATVSIGAVATANDLDPRYPAYQSKSGVSGTVKSIGSDTLNNLMTLWAEGFNKAYPGVKIEIEGKGSSTAPPALIAGTAGFGPMSRPMRSTEIDGFEKKYGYKPTEVRVAVDALAVFVHKDNPIKCLSLAQVDGIFSSSRTLGGADITKWDQLGLGGEYAGKPISLFGRNSASGTYGYFKEVAMGNGDYKATVKKVADTQAIIDSVVAYITSVNYKDFPDVVAMVEDAFDQLGKTKGLKEKHEGFAAKKDWENANLWAEQIWQYQVKTADLGLRAKTYLEQNGAKKIK